MIEQKELVRRWVEALESGKYVHTPSVLRYSDNKMCCLGVLLDVISPYTWEEIDSNYSYNQINGKSRYYLEDNICQMVGFKRTNSLDYQDRQLAGINDMSTDYKPAIEWIKKNLLGE